MESPTLIITADGSHSLLSNQYQVAYHSLHGAIQETNHVFIEAGLSFLLEKKQSVNLLELGFGTGLNAFMTFLQAQQQANLIQYTSLERNPINWSLASQFNYLPLLKSDEFAGVFQHMHTAPDQEWQHLSDVFRFRKITGDIASFQTTDLFNLIYYDAFSPDIQPELWTEARFQQMYNIMVPGGVLVTYCAKGSVKRALKAAGFSIEGLPGPPGKREMTRALKKLAD